MTDYSYTGAIQNITITTSGTYHITAEGAAGGTETGNNSVGGDGAEISGNVFLNAGDEIEILVGGEGGSGLDGGGGGGGSFVYDVTTSTLLAAAGGGGGGGTSTQGIGNGGNGQTGTSGGNGGTASGNSTGGAGGANGGGGQGADEEIPLIQGFATASDGGGGGGGYQMAGGKGVGTAGGGASFLNGGTGGTANGNAGAGGFGGGGGGSQGIRTVGGQIQFNNGGDGGGGGGYSGGGGADGNFGGGGGGSFLIASATNAIEIAGVNTGNGDVSITLCYLIGTNILTPSGQKPIESLIIGDDIVTRFGGIQKIKWLGRQSYAPRFIANNPEKWPVHITSGALDGTLPHRDLFISPGHSMLIGDKLILAENLVNGITIRQDRPDQDIDYIQIELEAHDCIQAEGAWSETYADAPGLRTQFHNQAEFWALYPDYLTPEQLTLCAPRPERGPALAAALHPLLPAHTPGPLRGCIDQITMAGIEGWAQDSANPHLPLLLDIHLSGRRYASILACDFRADLAEAGIGNGHHAFVYRASLPELFLPHLTIHRTSDGAQLHPAKHHQKAA